MKMKKTRSLDMPFMSLVLCLILALFTVYMKIGHIKKLQRALDANSISFFEMDLAKGDIVPPVQVDSLTGEKKNLLDFQASYRLLLIASTECSTCDEQIGRWWPRLISDPALETTAPALVFTEDVDAIINKLGDQLNVGDIYAAPGERFKRAYRDYSSPSLALVSSNGTVVYLVKGVLSEDSYASLVEFVNNNS